jgi:hypothetical protein
MEYIETPDGQIQADFARRVGRVVLHYEAAMERSDPGGWLLRKQFGAIHS